MLRTLRRPLFFAVLIFLRGEPVLLGIQACSPWGGSWELDFRETRGESREMSPHPGLLFWASVSHSVGVKYRGTPRGRP